MIYGIGIGKIKKSHGGTGFEYNGSFPVIEGQDETQVALIPMATLEAMIKTHEDLLTLSQFSMPKGFFERRDIELPRDMLDLSIPPIFPDEIKSNVGTKDETKLYLDRHFYSLDTTQTMWLRYASVNHSLNEEEPVNGGPEEWHAEDGD